MDKETQEKISRLQMMDQNLQLLLAQRQQLAAQLAEAESAINELDTQEPVYKLVGNILVKSDPAILKKELKERKELIELRVKSVEKQEGLTRERSTQLKDEVMKVISKEQEK